MIQAATQGKAGVYTIVNIVNWKRYIGSSANLDERFRQHRKTLKSNTHFNLHLQNAVNKYGFDNFCFFVLEYCECDVNKILELEDKWMKYFKSERLYNIRLTPESNLGVKFSQEIKDKMSENHPLQKAVKKYHLTEDILLEEYRSVAEASRKNKVNAHAIIRNCNGVNKKPNKYRWKYSSDITLPDKAVGYRYPNKRVFQICPNSLEVIRVFESVSVAAANCGIHKTAIYLALSGKSNTCAGFKWKYEE